MAIAKKMVRWGLIPLLLFSFLLCPLAAAPFTEFSTLPGKAQFETDSPVTFESSIDEQALPPTPPPTLGPGQIYNSDDAPDLMTIVGDEKYGYGEIKGASDLYLLWVTDESGTHYVTIGGKNPQLLSDNKPDDFNDLLEQRADRLDQLRDKRDKVIEHKQRRLGFDVGAVVTVGVGVIACGFSGGLCFVPFAVGALTAVVNAYVQDRAAQSLQPSLNELIAELEKAHSNLVGRFKSIEAEFSSP
jgi:hypothetical protein